MELVADVELYIFALGLGLYRPQANLRPDFRVVLSFPFAYDGRRCGYRNPRIVFTIQFIDQTSLYAHTNYFELNFCSADRISFPNGSLDNPLLWLIDR